MRLLALFAAINGVQVDVVQEDFKREHGPAGSAMLEEDFRIWFRSYTRGNLPAEARIVDRWQRKNSFSSYALVERPGMLRTIQDTYEERTRGLKSKALLPGWAQMHQGRNRAGWIYMGSVAVGLLTGASMAVMASDHIDRRDRETVSKLMEYYDNKANDYYWLSVVGYSLAAVAYSVNVIDGLFIRVAPYQLLSEESSPAIEFVARF